jgi:hypothetical protein
LSIVEGNLPEVHVHVTFGRMRPFSDDAEDNCLARTGFRRGDDGRDVKNCTTSLTNFQSFFFAWAWAWAWTFAWASPLLLMFMHRVNISRAKAEVRVLRAGVGGAQGTAGVRV